MRHILRMIKFEEGMSMAWSSSEREGELDEAHPPDDKFEEGISMAGSWPLPLSSSLLLSSGGLRVHLDLRPPLRLMPKLFS
jgi:hypothetical protein